MASPRRSTRPAVATALRPGAGQTPGRGGGGLTLPFGVVYILLTVGWILSAQLLSYPGVDLVGQIMWQFGEFLAIVAAPAWFVVSSRYVRARFVWLSVGVLVLVPWPVLLGFFG